MQLYVLLSLCTRHWYYYKYQDFFQLYDSQTTVQTLSADQFRKSLADYFKQGHNEMADAFEVFVCVLILVCNQQQELLEFIHNINCESCCGELDQPGKPLCISHQVGSFDLHTLNIIFQFFGFEMREKSICTFCGDEMGKKSTHYFYQVYAEQIMTAIDYYKNQQIPEEDYLSNLLLFAMKTDYPRCLLSAGCP